MVEFVKICPKCNKTYTNGAIGRCGNCKVKLINIKFDWITINYDTGVVKIVYKLDSPKTPLTYSKRNNEK